jgi:hypothetical protein
MMINGYIKCQLFIIKATQLASSDNFYYIDGNNTSNESVLVKVNPDNSTVINVLDPNQYDLFNFSVSSDDEIIFIALRMSIGVIIIGEIDSSGIPL